MNREFLIRKKPEQLPLMPKQAQTICNKYYTNNFKENLVKKKKKCAIYCESIVRNVHKGFTKTSKISKRQKNFCYGNNPLNYDAL